MPTKLCTAASKVFYKRMTIYVDLNCSLDKGHDGDHWDATFFLYWPGNLAEAV